MVMESAPPFLKPENVIIFWKSIVEQEAEILEPVISNFSKYITECTLN